VGELVVETLDTPPYGADCTECEDVVCVPVDEYVSDPLSYPKLCLSRARTSVGGTNVDGIGGYVGGFSELMIAVENEYDCASLCI
jgi:hypothetical protein